MSSVVNEGDCIGMLYDMLKALEETHNWTPEQAHQAMVSALDVAFQERFIEVIQSEGLQHHDN